MISEELRAAIEQACTDQVAETGYRAMYATRHPKPIPYAAAVDLLRRIVDQLPPSMTVSDLVDELCHGNNQGGEE